MLTTNKINEKELHKEQKLRMILIFPVVFLLFGLIIGNNENSLLTGLYIINKSPTILITDFFKIGGIGSAFINSALISFYNVFLLKKYKLRLNGLLIAAFMTVLGFSFFGKNIFNILPIYLGGYIYCKYQDISFKNVILVIMFSTALAPIVSEIAFSGIIIDPYSKIVAMVFGILIGFIIVPLSSHMLRFHDGFNLYNIGFTAGIVGTVITSILRSFDISIVPVNKLYSQKNYYIIALLFILFIYLIFLGFTINKDVLKQYKYIFKYSGRTITDFTQLLGYGITFFNMGVMGIICLSFVLLVGGIVNGPVLAGIFTIVGFSAFGKHPKNCFPIVTGVILAGILLKYDFSSTGFIISVLFSTTIAPIAGVYGFLPGFIAGMLHLTLVSNVGVIHGGINLYNNGFSGGLVAGFLVPIIEAFKKGDE